MSTILSVQELPFDALTLLSSLPMPVLLIGDDNKVFAANEASEHLFDRSNMRIKGRKVDDIVQFKDSRINAAICDNEEDISAQNMEIVTPVGNIFVDLWVTSLPLHSNWRILMIIKRTAKRDYIGDHSEAGDQLALGAPAILSHEIKNPLAGIKGAAQFLSKKADGSAKAMTQLIVDEVDRIARLLDQMQNLGNKTPVNFKAENIHIILDQMVQSIKVANPKFPDIMCHYDPSLPDVYVDYDAVLQILINLVQNAIDACENVDTPKIIVSTRYVMSGALREASEDGENRKTIKLPIEVTISDNGPGVPQHIKNELFTPFVSTKRDGQGLGLAIVRKFVRQLNSRILYERDEKRETTIFRLLLPMSVEVKADV